MSSPSINLPLHSPPESHIKSWFQACEDWSADQPIIARYVMEQYGCSGRHDTPCQQPGWDYYTDVTSDKLISSLATKMALIVIYSAVRHYTPEHLQALQALQQAHYAASPCSSHTSLWSCGHPLIRQRKRLLKPRTLQDDWLGDWLAGGCTCSRETFSA